MDFLNDIFTGEGFMPHGHCYLWSPEVLWPHLIGDILTFIAYILISIGIYLFARRRPGLKERNLFLLFSAFILVCGLTHLVDIVTIWIPIYHLEAIMKLLTGGISIITAIFLMRVLPKVLKLPSEANLKAVNQALGQSKQTISKLSHRLETITSLSPAIIYLYDRQEQKNIYSNRSIESLLGYTEEEIKQKENLFAETIHPEDLPKVLDHHQNVLPHLDDDTAVSIEYRMQEKNSTQYRWLRSQEKVFERSAEGEVKIIVGAASDITQEKASGLTALRKLNLNLQSTQKDLEQFVYAVSHDLRAPVRHILGYMEMINEEVDIPEQTQHYLQRVDKSAHRIRNMIDGLLQYSRNQNTPLTKSVFSLQAQIENLYEDFMAQIQQETQKVEWDIEALPEVYADQGQIRQVLENLISNAIKYSSKKPISKIKISAEPIEEQVWIHIADNGVGFDMAHENKLFKLFHRLHTQDEFPGTGLGLINSYKIMERHEGQIKAHAKLGEGAIFSILLPLVSDTQQTKH